MAKTEQLDLSVPDNFIPYTRKGTLKAIAQDELSEPELVGEEVLFQSGSFRRVRRYYRGWHPEMGELVQLGKGLTGRETIMEMDVITPFVTFSVKDSSVNGSLTNGSVKSPELNGSIEEKNGLVKEKI